MYNRTVPPNPDRSNRAAPRQMRPRRTLYFMIAGVALVVFAGAGLTYAWTRPSAPVADSTGSQIADECRAALGYPARTDADMAWLRQCTSALSPGSHETMPPPPATTSPAGATTSAPVTATSSSGANAAPAGPVVHGKDINTTNTGYLAWTGPNGQRCTDATLKVYQTRVDASALGNATCVWLKGGINVDKAVTLTAARIDQEVKNYGPRLTLNWCTVDDPGQDQAIAGHVDAYRCQLLDASDGVRFDGTNVIETYIRLKIQSILDHNDGIQAYMADAGGSILRSNIDGRPIGAPSQIIGNAAIFIADGSKGEVVIRDNYLAGGEYALRLHESATYRVTGNIIYGYNSGPVLTTNAIPGAFLEWSNNRTGSGALIDLHL